MTDLLYCWPAAAQFGRAVPKAKFHDHAAIPTSAREKFRVDVQRITWAFKLAEGTINLPGSVSVPEIQVFQVDAKGDDVAESVLVAIDQAVKTPIIFEVTRGHGPDQRVRMTATYKQVGVGTPKLGVYYTTGWQAGDARRQTLPTAITLPALYTALLEPLTSVAARPGEDASEMAARLATVRKLERQVAALERRIRTEPQLNRKVELRRVLRTKQAALAALTRGTRS